MRRYLIKVDGFDDFEVNAITAGKAKYQLWKRAEDAGYFGGRNGFRDFLGRIYVLHLGPAPSPMETKS